MTFINTTHPNDARGAVGSMYRQQQGAWGYVPNYAKVFSHRPEVLVRWGQLLAEIRRPMDLQRFELVTFVAAHELGNSACALAHGSALRAFFTEEQIMAIARGEHAGVLGAPELALLRFSRQVAADASQVTQADVARLREVGWTDADIFDAAATAAGRAFFTKLLDALGVKADVPFQALGQAFREALTVGRPIDDEPTLAMPPQEAGMGNRSQGS